MYVSVFAVLFASAALMVSAAPLPNLIGNDSDHHAAM
ncbi:hypothetical protein PIIN_05871 [Serendipita indica DSM 11827]|uniref:Uncharacterized protein n=1 Tax=Serendipita indica (strain DSM 11827) TaxID=1109443 RepID=G4TKU3_SERID|nr:hypothetical protein PIIN_05871 [Serendipita indica DSM 11827]